MKTKSGWQLHIIGIALLGVILFVCFSCNGDDDDNNDDDNNDSADDDTVEEGDQVHLAALQPSGELLWKTNEMIDGYWETITYSEEENIYFTDYQYPSTNNLYCYSKSGSLSWSKMISVQVDIQYHIDNILSQSNVLYWSASESNLDKHIVVKADAAGNELCSSVYAPEIDFSAIRFLSSNKDELLAIGSGDFTNGSPKEYVIIVSYSDECELNWQWQSEYISDWPGDVKTDDSKNVYLLYNTTLRSCAVAKIDPNGETLWEVLFKPEDTSTKVCEGNQLALDEDANVYVAARCGDYESCLIKFDAEGNYQWHRVRKPDPDFMYPLHQHVKIDNQQQVVYVETAKIGDKHTIVIVKYDTEGNMIWETYYGKNYSHRISPMNLELDKYDNNYLIGSVCDAVSYDTEECVKTRNYIIKYNCDGREEWTYERQSDDEDNVFIAEPGDEYLIALFGGYLFLSPALQPDREQ
ncbi:MAG TPA: hypothetical protein PKW95_10900 [bacterium]|nr:hypothetical protein [bacterium]